MIEVTAATAFLLYLAMSLAVLFILWSYRHFRECKKTIISPSEELFLCEYCHFLYMEKSNRSITRCPECHSFNKNNRYRD